jgi:hypothetical protein
LEVVMGYVPIFLFFSLSVAAGLGGVGTVFLGLWSPMFASFCDLFLLDLLGSMGERPVPSWAAVRLGERVRSVGRFVGMVVGAQ